MIHVANDNTLIYFKEVSQGTLNRSIILLCIDESENLDKTSSISKQNHIYLKQYLTGILDVYELGRTILPAKHIRFLENALTALMTYIFHYKNNDSIPLLQSDIKGHFDIKLLHDVLVEYFSENYFK